jgi:hypothetical protein
MKWQTVRLHAPSESHGNFCSISLSAPAQWAMTTSDKPLHIHVLLTLIHYGVIHTFSIKL